MLWITTAAKSRLQLNKFTTLKTKKLIAILCLAGMWLYTAFLHVLHFVYLPSKKEDTSSWLGLYDFFNALKFYEWSFALIIIPLLPIGILVDGMGYRPRFVMVSLFLNGVAFLPIYPVGTIIGSCFIAYALFMSRSGPEHVAP